MQNLLTVRKFKVVLMYKMEPIISLFVSFLVVSIGVLGYSLLKAEK
jgi:hypothetical protein